MNVTATMIQKLLSLSFQRVVSAFSRPLHTDLSRRSRYVGVADEVTRSLFFAAQNGRGELMQRGGGATRRAVSSQTPSFPPLPSPSPAESVWESRGWWCVCHALFLSQAMFLPPPSGEVVVSARRRLGWEARTRTSSSTCSAFRTSFFAPPHPLSRCEHPLSLEVDLHPQGREG